MNGCSGGKMRKFPFLKRRTKQGRAWTGMETRVCPGSENAAAVYATTMYFPGGGSSHPSRKIMEDKKEKGNRGDIDASDMKQPCCVPGTTGIWIKALLFPAAHGCQAVAVKEKKRREVDEERHLIKYLCRFAPYAERAEGQKTAAPLHRSAGVAPSSLTLVGRSVPVPSAPVRNSSARMAASFSSASSWSNSSAVRMHT